MAVTSGRMYESVTCATLTDYAMIDFGGERGAGLFGLLPREPTATPSPRMIFTKIEIL